VKQFREHFGEQVVFVRDIARTTEAQDREYDLAAPTDARREGFQIQHRTAAEEAKWSLQMARDVIVDAMLLARTNVMFHVVSNISTAVAYMNPDVQLRQLEEAEVLRSSGVGER